MHAGPSIIVLGAPWHEAPIPMTVSPAEFDAFESKCGVELEDKQSELAKSFGLGTWPTWNFSGDSGLLTFHDQTGVVRVKCRAIVVGSFSTRGESWNWAWANESYPVRVREEATVLRGLAWHTGMEIFDQAAFYCDEEMAWSVAAMSVHHLRALGCYRAPASKTWIFLAIMEATRSSARN
jgi:hypothetical protein